MSDKIDFKNIKQFEELANEAVNKTGYSQGDDAKNKVDIFKTYTEFKRNKYLFWNAIILSVIAVTNLIIQIVKLICGSN
jgi:hypothetical protein